MKTEIKRSDYPDTPDGQHSYEMKVYSEELASKHKDAMLLEEMETLLEQIKFKERNEPRN